MYSHRYSLELRAPFLLEGTHGRVLHEDAHVVDGDARLDVGTELRGVDAAVEILHGLAGSVRVERLDARAGDEAEVYAEEDVLFLRKRVVVAQGNVGAEGLQLRIVGRTPCGIGAQEDGAGRFLKVLFARQFQAAPVEAQTEIE